MLDTRDRPSEDVDEGMRDLRRFWTGETAAEDGERRLRSEAECGSDALVGGDDSTSTAGLVSRLSSLSRPMGASSAHVASRSSRRCWTRTSSSTGSADSFMSVKPAAASSSADLSGESVGGLDDGAGGACASMASSRSLSPSSQDAACCDVRQRQVNATDCSEDGEMTDPLGELGLGVQRRLEFGDDAEELGSRSAR